MHLTTPIATAVLAFAATTAALPESAQGVLNNCHESIWVTFTNSTKDTTGPLEVKTGGGFASSIVGNVALPLLTPPTTSPSRKELG